MACLKLRSAISQLAQSRKFNHRLPGLRKGLAPGLALDSPATSLRFAGHRLKPARCLVLRKETFIRVPGLVRNLTQGGGPWQGERCREAAVVHPTGVTHVGERFQSFTQPSEGSLQKGNLAPWSLKRRGFCSPMEEGLAHKTPGGLVCVSFLLHVANFSNLKFLRL